MLRIEKTAFSSTLQSVITGNPSNLTYTTAQYRLNYKTHRIYRYLKGLRTLQRFLQRFFQKNRGKNLCPHIKLLKKYLQL